MSHAIVGSITSSTPGQANGRYWLDATVPPGTPIYAPIDGLLSPTTDSLNGYGFSLSGSDGKFYYVSGLAAPAKGGVASQVQYGEQIGTAASSKVHIAEDSTGQWGNYSPVSGNMQVESVLYNPTAPAPVQNPGDTTSSASVPLQPTDTSSSYMLPVIPVAGVTDIPKIDTSKFIPSIGIDFSPLTQWAQYLNLLNPLAWPGIILAGGNDPLTVTAKRAVLSVVLLLIAVIFIAVGAVKLASDSGVLDTAVESVAKVAEVAA